MNLTKSDFPVILEITSKNRKKEVANLITNIKLFVDKDIKLPNNKPCITATQMRNIYSKVLECKSNLDFQLLRPQLAYIVGRSNEDKLGEIIKLFDDLILSLNATLFTEKLGIEILNEEDYVKNLHTFFESVVAYHKFYYGDK